MSLSALRFNPVFRLASLLALWVMLFPAVLPLLHSPAAMGGSRVICHMAGGSDQKQTPAPEKSKPDCPICQTLGQMAQGFVAPEPTGLAQVNFVSETAVRTAHTPVVFEASSPSWPRAPPALA